MINPTPIIPSYSATVASLIEDLSAFFDDGSAGMQRLVARVPFLLGADRAYIGRISPDGARFAVTQASSGDWPDLLGYTQSVARLPAFARGSLKSGVQGTIADASAFPFTPQQRKMICYAGLGATVVTPIPCLGTFVGALILDAMRDNHAWDNATLDQCKLLAEAIGARLALARMGDHLASEDRDPIHDMLRLNVLANIARSLEKSNDPVAISNEVLDELGALHWLRNARLAEAKDVSDVVRTALATEALVVRATVGGTTMVGLPLIFEGERFGAFEMELVARSLTDVEEQFLRTVQTFAGSAFATARRRARPRDESQNDPLTGMLSYRSVHEHLVEAVHASKSSDRPVSVWLVEVEGLDRVNKANGFAVGDDVVGYVGHTIGAAVSGRGQAGRVRGGSFMVVFAGMELEEASVGARMMVERIVKNAPGHLPEVATTIGVSSYPSQAGGHEDLERMARMALYTAKNAGRNRVATSNASDPNWQRDAHACFVRIVSAQQLPAAMQPRLKA